MPSLMTLWGRVNNQFQGRLKDNIFFMHIPKCGGASISHAINWRYRTLNMRHDRYLLSLDPAASSEVIRIIEQTNYPYDTTDDYPILKFRENLLLYSMGQKNVKYISGHFTFSELAYREFHNKYAFVTVLRDPVKRWISAYFYNRFKKVDHRKIELDIIPYLQSEFGRSQGYEYVKFLGGANASGDYSSKEAINRAQRNLHKFDIVGFLENQKEFLKQFQNRFGIRLKLEKRNLNPVSISFRDTVITEELMEKIKVICRPDYEVYQYATENFAEKNQ